MQTKEVSECIVCYKPLGADSKSARYLTCHEHRACIKCTLPLTPREIKWCYDKLVEDADGEQVELPDIQANLRLIHARCSTLDIGTSDATQSIKQSELDRLNLIRLMIEPNLELSNTTNENNAYIYSTKYIEKMSNDERLTHLRMLEACVENVSRLLKTDRKELQRVADEREKKAFAKAEKQALTSTRPTNKPEDDAVEIALGLFMKTHGLTERTMSIKLWKEREKAVHGLVKIGANEIQVRESITKEMIEQGRLPK